MRFITVFFTAVLLIATATLSFGQTISTSKDDYEPGETVIFTGSGFEPGEVVNVSASGNTNGTQIDLQVTADESGHISGSFATPLVYEETFYVTATGTSSGAVAQTSFNDSVNLFREDPKATSVTLDCQSRKVFKVKAGNPGAAGVKVVWTATAGSPLYAETTTPPGGIVEYSHTAGSTHLGLYYVTASTGSGSGKTEQTWTVTTLCPPLCTPPVLTCPDNILVNNDPGKCGAVVSFGEDASASATGDPTPTITYAPASGSFFPIGTTTVTVTADNGCAPSPQPCFFSVTVVDNEAPSISGVPSDITLYTKEEGATSCEVAATWSDPSAVDNCPGATLSSSPASGSLFPVGKTTTVTLTATDAAGNSASSSFTVTVIDNTPPSISGAPSDITLYTGPGATSCGVALKWSASAADNCPGATLSSSHASGYLFPVGETTTVTLTATDAAGNSALSSFTVTVNDDTPPSIVAPGSKTFPLCEYNSAALGSATASDNCGVGPVTNNAPSSVMYAGTFDVEWKATDVHGNIGSAKQPVTITYGALQGFLPPMAANPHSISVKKGRTVPIKFRATQCPNNAAIYAFIYVDLVSSPGGDVISPLEVIGTSASDVGNEFRYSASDDQYIFNLDTTRWEVNRTYRVRAALKDGQVIDGYIKVTK